MSKMVIVGYGSIGKRHASVAAKFDHDLIIIDNDVDAQAEAQNEHADALILGNVRNLARVSLGENAAGVVATWAPSHSKVYHELVEAGCRRILCEKPLTNSLQSAAAMCEHAEKHDIRLLVNHKFRYSGALDNILAWIETYDLGNPVKMISCAGAVGLINKGVHLVDVSREVFATAPKSVISTAESDRLNPRSTDLDYYGGTMVWKFGNSREAVLSYSNKSSVTQDFRIYFRNAVLYMNDMYDVEIRRRLRQEVEEYPEVTRHGFADDVVYSSEDIIESNKLVELENVQQDLFADGHPKSPGDLGKEVLQMCVGGLIAAKEGSETSFPITKEHMRYDFEWQFN